MNEAIDEIYAVIKFKSAECSGELRLIRII